MPGGNCSIFGCSTSRNHIGISLHRIPTKDDEYSCNWRQKIVQIITRDRVIDASLRKQIDKRNLYVCELHYSDDKLLRHETRTTLIPGTLPTLNLPKKSFQTSSTATKPRKSAEVINIKKDSFPTPIPVLTDCYKSFEEFCNRTKLLKLPDQWQVTFDHESFVHISKQDALHELPEIDVYVDKSLIFKIRVYTWFIPSDHPIYSINNQSLKNITLSNLIKNISVYNICAGIVDPQAQKYLTRHSIPKRYNPIQNGNTTQTEYYRSTDCLLMDNAVVCMTCIKHGKAALSQSEKTNKRRTLALQTPAKPNAPISLTSPERVKLTIQNFRAENKELKTQIQQLQDEISQSSLTISENLSDDLVSIMSNADPSKISPFMKFFWDEQQKYLSSSSTGVRYHPMIIRYCLSLASKSASAYDDIRYDEQKGTGFLILPSRRRLRDYKNYIKPQRGFNKHIVEELKHKVKDFSEPEKFVVILLDEMKIQENLVWDKHTGELIGYVDLGDIDLNYATLEKSDDIATHVLVFMLRSIVNPFKFSLANFATSGASALQMFPLFWKAVSICELNKLKVIAVTCDGASPNRKLFRMNFDLTLEDDMNPDVDVTYRTDNLFSDEKRFIYFISDPPHLMKTARNCLSNSGSGRCTRYMWNNEMFILWNHISDIFYEDRECGLHLLPKLTYEHIKLTPYSVMNVKLAAQVLSSTVSNVLSNYGPPEAAGTAKFCSLMDTFFDILNIRSTNAHQFERKPFLLPFTSINDPRFSWLRNVFLQYFQDWLQSIEQRPGNFSKTARNNMFLSHQTYEGIKITCHSIIEAVQFLLQHQVDYVLTERFCQDPLENYFGRQRALGARKDNPSMRDFGFNDNAIRNQKVFRPISGNVGGGDHAIVDFSNEPIPCRKKPRKN